MADKWECEYCGKLYSRKSDCERHERKEHIEICCEDGATKIADKWECNSCGRLFATKDEAMHHEEGQRTCDVCLHLYAEGDKNCPVCGPIKQDSRLGDGSELFLDFSNDRNDYEGLWNHPSTQRHDLFEITKIRSQGAISFKKAERIYYRRIKEPCNLYRFVKLARITSEYFDNESLILKQYEARTELRKYFWAMESTWA